MDVPSCSNAPDGDESELMPRRRPLRRDKTTCYRCNTARSLIVSRFVAYCGPCFERNVSPRLFRVLHPALATTSHLLSAPSPSSSSGTTARPNPKPAKRDKASTPSGIHIRPRTQPGSLLLALSGGAGSTAMMDILNKMEYYAHPGQAKRDKKKGEKEPVWMKAWGVYVDFQGVVGELHRRAGGGTGSGISGGEERRKGEQEVQRVRAVAEKGGLEFVCIRAEEVFDPQLGERLAQVSRGGAGGARVNEAIETGKPQAGHPSQVLVNLADPALPLTFPSTSTPNIDSTTPESAQTAPSAHLDTLVTLLLSVPPPSRPSILSQVLDTLLLAASQGLPQISHLLVGETSTREAARVVSATAAGRGWALPLELSPARMVIPTENGLEKEEGNGETKAEQVRASHARFPVVKIKPMKDISIKEAAFWCYLAKLETVNQRRWDSGPRDRRGARGSAAGSIEALTEQFIATLNTSHPSTVSTINKTGDKLVFPGSTGQDQPPLCPFCQMPVDPSALAWKSSTSLTSLSSTLRIDDSSTSAPSLSTPQSDLTTPTTLPRPRPSSSSIPLAPLLCYACLTTFTPLTAHSKDSLTSHPVELPLWVGAQVQRRLGGGGRVRESESEREKERERAREEQKEIVKEFMIDQEE